MKILFVRPKPSSETIGLQHIMVVEPLELEVLSALCRPGDTRLLADMILEKKPFSAFLRDFRPDLVCFTAYITHVDTVTSLCKEIRRDYPGTVTAVGGVHCEVCPDDFDDESVNFRVVRNAVKVFPLLLQHLESGSALPPEILTPGQPFLPEKLPLFDFSMPLPDRLLTARYRKNYFYIFHDRVALLKTSFGCPYHCAFCFCIRITGGKYRQRPLSRVMDELEGIAEKEIYIVDDDFLADSDRLEKFITACAARKINKHYLVYGRADFIAEHPELMEKLKNTGLKTVIVGLESFDEGELEKYNKRIIPETNRKAMQILNRLGIDCFATLIVPPHWDKPDFREMTRNLISLGVHFVNLQPLTPLPGTDLAFPENQLIIDRRDYGKWDLAHISLKPEKLPVAEFYSEMLRAYRKIIFQPRFLIRHIRRYPVPMLARMFLGAAKVTIQYRRKIKEARHHA
jgi:radical SAM superfamily enzyme YgiQ (UPF0313 family)